MVAVLIFVPSKGEKKASADLVSEPLRYECWYESADVVRIVYSGELGGHRDEVFSRALVKLTEKREIRNIVPISSCVSVPWNQNPTTELIVLLKPVKPSATSRPE